MNNDDAPAYGIPLAKVIEDLRAELLFAIAGGRDKALRFKLEPVELELTVGMTYKGGATANVKFWVLELGAKGDAERAGSYKLKLKLTPIDRDGGTPIADHIDFAKSDPLFREA